MPDSGPVFGRKNLLTRLCVNKLLRPFSGPPGGPIIGAIIGVEFTTRTLVAMLSSGCSWRGFCCTNCCIVRALGLTEIRQHNTYKYFFIRVVVSEPFA